MPPTGRRSWSWSGGPLGRGARLPIVKWGAQGIPNLALAASVQGWGPAGPRGRGVSGSGLLWMGQVRWLQDYGFLCLPLVGEAGLVAPQVDDAVSWPSGGQGRVHQGDQGGLKAACLLPAGSVTPPRGCVTESPGSGSDGPGSQPRGCVHGASVCPGEPRLPHLCRRHSVGSR